MNSPTVILFHSRAGKDAVFLSNMFPLERSMTVEYHDMLDDDGHPHKLGPFSAAEPAFHAGKHLPHTDMNTLVKKFCGPEVSGHAAKRRGGRRAMPMTCEQLREWEGDGDMDARRVRVMRDVLRAKFGDPHLRQRLLDTGDAELVERLPRFADAFWGTLNNGEGKNVLGRLLMEERARIRRENAN